MYCNEIFVFQRGKMVNIVVQLCHNWIVDGRTVKGGSRQKWMSTGCTVKCGPETMLSNGAEELLFICN